MKRRFPGDQHLPPGMPLANDPRRMNPQRGPPPAHFQPRGGPPNHVIQGRGPPPAHFQLRGGPPNHVMPGRAHRGQGGRGMGRPAMGRANIMGRGNIPGQAQRGRPLMGARGHGPVLPTMRRHLAPPPSIPPQVPPPPPRAPIGHPPLRGGPGIPQTQLSHNNVPQPPVLNYHAPSGVIPGHRPPPQPFPSAPLQPHLQNHSAPVQIGGSQVNSTHQNQLQRPAATTQPGQARPVITGTQGYSPYSGGGQPGLILRETQGRSTGASETIATAGVSTATHHGVERIDQNWKEYTAPSGVKYYHNTSTGESTYTKPAALANKASQTTPTSVAKRPWQEYEDPKTGKKYYSDGLTTTWEKPAGFKSENEKAPAVAAEAEPQKKKKKTEAKKESLFNNRDEAIAAFKGLLLAKGIAPTLKWNEVLKICSNDSRWEACEEKLTIGERRQALAEYQTKRANELKTLERQERIRAKEAFGQLLTEVLPSVQKFSARSSNFSDFRAALSKDDRFYAVEEEETREGLFLDFCEEFRKREERQKRSKKREAKDAFLSFLREHEETGGLSFASTWESFIGGLNERAKLDARFEVSSAMSDSDRQLYFADFVIELQVAEDDKRRRIRDARRRAEKAQRDGYRDCLRRVALNGKIHPGSRWRSVEELISADESFGLVQSQDRDAPRELFEEFLDEWGENYRRDRSFLSQLLHPNSKNENTLLASSTYEEFTKMLLDEAAYSPTMYGDARRIINRNDPVSSARILYNDLIVRAKESAVAGTSRLGNASRRGSLVESSEDEGEIIEDGEVTEEIDDATRNDSVESRLKSTEPSIPSSPVKNGVASATTSETEAGPALQKDHCASDVELPYQSHSTKSTLCRKESDAVEATVNEGDDATKSS